MHTIHVMPNGKPDQWDIILGDDLGVPAAATIRRLGRSAPGITFHQEAGGYLSAYALLASELLRNCNPGNDSFKVVTTCQGR